MRVLAGMLHHLHEVPEVTAPPVTEEDLWGP